MPNSSRSALQISPTVQRARNASCIGGKRFASPRAASGSRRWSSICSDSGSTYLLTPTITLSPASTWWVYANAACSISCWTKPCSIAATAPPSSSTRSISSLARSSSLFVRSSRKNEPPRGSAVSVPPASWARICCVRRATRTERSLGSASASSNAFVWIDCAPPHTAESACTAPRTTLFSGCWAVSVDPPVWAWNRSACAFGFSTPNRSRMIRAHSRRAGFADVVAGDRDRVPVRQPLGAIGEQVGRQPHRRAWRKDVVPTRDVLLEDVVLDGAAEPGPAYSLLLADELVEEQEQRSARVDRHRGGDLG